MTLTERIAAYDRPGEEGGLMDIIDLDNATLRRALDCYVQARNEEGAAIVLELLTLGRAERYAAGLGVEGDDLDPSADYTPVHLAPDGKTFLPIAPPRPTTYTHVAALLRAAADLMDIEPEHVAGVNVEADAVGGVFLTLSSPVINTLLPRDQWRRSFVKAHISPLALAESEHAGRYHLAERSAALRVAWAQARGEALVGVATLHEMLGRGAQRGEG